MKEEIRRAIAVSAAKQINGHCPTALFSYEKRSYASMGDGYDYEAGAAFTMSGSNLYHYGVGGYVNLKIEGNKFSGYDYSAGQNYTGSVNGRSVQIYDYGEGRYYNYIC